VTFVDGTTGEVHIRLFLSNPSIDGTIFEALWDPAVFGHARVVLGAIQWPNGADLALDAMYDAIRQRGFGCWINGMAFDHKDSKAKSKHQSSTLATPELTTAPP
jgi:hypothetical protein